MTPSRPGKHGKSHLMSAGAAALFTPVDTGPQSLTPKSGTWGMCPVPPAHFGYFKFSVTIYGIQAGMVHSFFPLRPKRFRLKKGNLVTAASAFPLPSF